MELFDRYFAMVGAAAENSLLLKNNEARIAAAPTLVVLRGDVNARTPLNTSCALSIDSLYYDGVAAYLGKFSDAFICCHVFEPREGPHFDYFDEASYEMGEDGITMEVKDGSRYRHKTLALDPFRDI